MQTVIEIELEILTEVKKCSSKKDITQLNIRFFREKPLKDKNSKALIIHPLNEMTEFVHEQRISSQNFQMNV